MRELRRGGALARLGLCAGVFGLAIWSAVTYLGDRGGRARLEREVTRFGLLVRRPLGVEAMRLEPAEDQASAVFADLVLEDALGGVVLKELPPDVQRAWIESAARVGEELNAANDLMLDAVRTRPGWAYLRFLLGQLVYASERRSPEPGSGDKPQRWIRPLQLAAVAAPGSDGVWSFLGGAQLEAWDRLPGALRSDVPAVLSRAFLDPGFVTRGFHAAAEELSRDRTVSLLPDRVGPLQAAFEVVVQDGDAVGAAEIFRRREEAEIQQRASDVARIEDLHSRGDVEGLRSACLSFSYLHPAAQRDDRVSRAQVARVLELWPEEFSGSWRNDVRADLIRYFLNGRRAGAPGAAMARAANALSEVPDPVRARVDLLAGDVEGAEQLARSYGPSFEWTPYLVELGGTHLARGLPAKALEAVERIAPAARDECDVLLLRRGIARELNDQAELDLVALRLGAAVSDSYPPEAWSPRGTLALCLDPENSADSTLTVRMDAPSPALVAYGWNGGRSGTLLAKGELSLSTPLASRAGRQAFQIWTLAGVPLRPGAASISGGGNRPPD